MMLDQITVQDVLAILGVVGAAAVGVGKAIKWYVDRQDTKNREAIEREGALRKAIEDSFEERIRSLEVELAAQREIVKTLNLEKQIFLRRIYQLESYIQVRDLDVPNMEGWPP